MGMLMLNQIENPETQVKTQYYVILPYMFRISSLISWLKAQYTTGHGTKI